VTHNSTRKHFFAKLLGVVAAASVVPKLLAKSTVSAATRSPAGAGKTGASAIEFHRDSRAVARRDLA
jgi:hypothetical protein